MIETYRATSKINKQQSEKDRKLRHKFQYKEADQNGPEDSHTQTHTQNDQPYLKNGIMKPQR